MLEDIFAKIFAKIDCYKNKILDLSMTKLILMFIIILFSLSSAHFLLYMYGYISVGAGDTFIMDHALYNTVKGEGLMTIGGVEHYPEYFNTTEHTAYSQYDNYWAGHKKIILVLIVPIYYIWPSLFNILLIQCIMLGLAALPLYKICKHFFDENTSKIISISYLLYPAVILNGVVGFHVPTFAPLFIFSMFYFYLNNKPLLHLISLILLLSLFENMFLISIPLAFYYILDTFFNDSTLKIKLYKYSMPTLIATVIYYGVFISYIIEPIFSPNNAILINNPSYAAHFGYIGSNTHEIILNSMAHPSLIINTSHAFKFLKYSFIMLFPLAFIPISSKKSILVLLTSFLIIIQNIISHEPTMESIYTRFQMVIVPFLFLSMIISVSNFQIEKKKYLKCFKKYYIYFSFAISLIYCIWFVMSYALCTRIYT